MPSFDLVSKVDTHEVANAVDQSNREVNTRFDFKGTGSKFELDDAGITTVSESEFQLEQMLDILRTKLNRRGVDIGCLDIKEPEHSGRQVRQAIIVRQGIESDAARRVVKEVKAAKLKVQAAIQGDQVRVSGKKRDDLQRIMSVLKELDLGVPVQFINFRD